MNFKYKLKKHIRRMLIILILILICFCYFKFSYKFNNTFPSSNIINDVSISESNIINEVRSVNKLIPLEIELTKTILIDKSFSDFEIFKKSKSIAFSANCSYYVDLSKLTTDDITLNKEDNLITLYIPVPEVYSIEIIEDKTVHEDVTLGLLRFGDILLSSEEYGTITDLIQSEIEKDMNSPHLISEAVNNTATQLKELVFNLFNVEYSFNLKIKDT